MAQPAVDKFGALLIRQLRDNAIDHFDRLAAQQHKAPAFLDLQRRLSELPDDVQAVVRDCVLSSVDTGLHDFLFGLVESHDADDGIAVIVDGTNIADASDGLHSEQFTDDGWVARFGAFDENGVARGG
ncbi:hypothetical protein SAMN06265222_1011156 [Neorhodopirellula lusitana]|uniref:Transposase n=1 Tax=Neorhodopirellula lusitana TaxID=445327 RepID=A0ABY1PT80_9BACT|nr:hypothetical protein [Neorhodopirellula lusitana]SMP44537.1 hypothetical protein SAMN06265222_1011156 [Neorhodopirellula lusitana]